MKKIFLAILSAMLLFAACGKEDIVNDSNYLNDDVEIVFQSNFGTAPATKAIINEIADLNNKDFGVYAYVNGVDDNNHYLINNGHYLITKDETDPNNIIYKAAATNGKQYFWPKSDNNNEKYTVDFLALYPYSTTAYNRNTNTVTVNIDAQTVGTNSTDVLYAVANNEYHQVVGTYNNTTPTKYYVPLKFRHILSLIEFKGKYAADNNITAVTVKKIEFLNADGTAYPITVGGTISFDMSTITVGTDPATDYYVPTKSFDGTTKSDLNFANNFVLNNSTYQSISNTILIPQTVPAKVRITFDITIQNTNAEAVSFTSREVTKTINSDADMHTTPVTYATTWESGKKYIYKYYITAETVEFTIEVVNWDATEFQVWDKE